MTKKKPSPQNRIWEKERRERLNKTFDSLARLLPDYEPATGLSKIEILQRAIELIEGLQQKVQAFLQQRDDLLRDHVDELEERLRNQHLRNEDLSALLRKANISVPPACKYDETKSKKTEKKQGTDEMKPSEDDSETTKDAGTDGDKQGQAVIEESERDIGKEAAPAVTVIVSAATLATTDTNSKSTNGMTAVAAGGGFSTCFVMTNGRNQVVGAALKPTDGCGGGVTVATTPALLPTPVMTTSVLISNNGSLLQVPVAVPSASSLLIVGNEDVRSKINLKKFSTSGGNVDGRSTSGEAKGKRNAKGNKFTIKSIDVIPGRIVNGKIPIPPLRAAKQEKRKLVRPRKKRKTTATATAAGTTERNSKKLKRTSEDDGEGEKEDAAADIGIGNSDEAQLVSKNAVVHDCPSESITDTQECKSQDIQQQQQQQQHQHQNVAIDINLNQTELSEDIFANLQVPDEVVPDNENQGSLSPSAAYLITFPLVAGGGKAGANHVDTGREESEEVIDSGDPKKETGAAVVDGSLILDNFSSFFNYGSALDTNVVGGTDGGLDIPITTAGATTNFSTIYQSIDNMLEHRPTTTMSTNTTSTRLVATTASDNAYVASTPFTFTLTPTATTINTAQSVSVSTSTSVASYKGCNIPTAAYPTKPVDDFSLKPSIEFTFSLTSTTASQPRTVQSQYTNSAILAPTITTPSYDTYGYYHKAAPKTNNFCPSFGLDGGTSGRLVQGEKPATSFTFSLTSSTRTLPTYTQSSLPPTAPASNQMVNSSSSSNATTTATLTASKHGKQKYQAYTSMSASTNSSAHGSAQLPTQPTQSKYDVPWMTSQDFKTTAGAIGPQVASAPVPPSSSATSYDFTQMLPPALDYVATGPPPSTATVAAPAPAYHSNFELNRKSDIFFAHPPGEENLTWSPSKLSNILNDTSSPYFPPATTLPNLNGDLALNTIGASGGTQINHANQANLSSCKLKKPAPTGGSEVGSSTFLSVRQLVDQSTKTYASCSQKTFNNNSYSAEALIAGSNSSSNVGGSTSHVTRKDKYYDGTTVTPVVAYGSSCSVENGSATGTGSLSFNFDYSTAEYNKNGYNFGGGQQGASYGTTFMDTTGYTGTGGSVSSGNGNYYSPDIGRKATQSYYHQAPSSPGYHLQASSVATDNVPYYHLPTNDKKTSQCGSGVAPTVGPTGGAGCLVKSRKSHTKLGHHLHDTVPSVSSTYFSVLPPPAPVIPPPPPPSQSHNRAEESSIYPNYHNFHAVTSTTNNSTTVTTTFNYQYNNNGGSSGNGGSVANCSNHHHHQQLPPAVFHENGRGLHFQQDSPQHHRHQHQHHHQHHHNHGQQHTTVAVGVGNFHHGHDHHHATTVVSGGGGTSGAGSGSLANFNLSTICPEISEKTVAGHVRPAQVASITAHW